MPGVEVRPIIHSSGNAWRLARLGVPLSTVDLLDASTVHRAIADCTHVVNCSRGTDQVMIRGLRNLLEASRRVNVAGFVHLSSVMVYGDPPPPEAVSESARIPRHPSGSYADTKHIQDRLVQRHAKDGLPSIILCPPNISGPYSYFLLGILEAIRTRQLALLDEGQSPCILVDVDNLCDAIELALDHASQDAPRLFVTDDDDATWRQVVEGVMPLLDVAPPMASISQETLEAGRRKSASAKPSVVGTFRHLMSSTVREALRQDPLLAKVDQALRRGVALMGESIESRFRLAIEGPICVPAASSAVRLNVGLCAQQLRSVRHSPAAARNRIGYRPSRTFADSMERFRSWYRQSHHMDSDYWDLLKRLY
jgi:nucleoside-diphosphate-sugar epimerase